ncbi:protein PRR14L [Leptodactylus fuscus]|uniref:protein PRR14L n=1 Tax=Leptodactylus fuscus TaxID=238119 RepID=UPI003F4F37ED
MLELDVLEERPHNALESSASRTVPHKWPVLHVPFIHEFTLGPSSISDASNPHQVVLQETHNSLTEIAEDAKFIPEPELVSSARIKDTGALFTLKSAVMLDTVETVTPMEICDSDQNMMLQESVESSDLQIREGFLEITVTRDPTDQLYVKDGHTLSDPISKMNDKAAGMEVMGTGAVLQSEQNERVGDLLHEPNRDESSDLGLSNSDKVLTKRGSLTPTEIQTSIEESPEGSLSDECTMLKSSNHQCLAYNTRDGDSVKCLEVKHLQCLQNSSVQKLFNTELPLASESFNERSVCKDMGFPCVNDVGSATCLVEKSEPNTDDDMNASYENVPTDQDLDMDFESTQQDIKATSLNKKDNDPSVAYPSDSAQTVNARLQDVQSETLKVDLLLYAKSVIEDGSKSPGIIEDDQSFTPNHPPCFENLTSAKALDNEECSFSSSKSDCNNPIDDGAQDCHKYTCANTLEDHASLAPATSICEEPLYQQSSADCSKTSFVDCHIKDSDLDGGTKEHVVMSVAPSNGLARNFRIKEPNINSICLSVETEKNEYNIPQTMEIDLLKETRNLTVTQSERLCDMAPAVMNDATTSPRTLQDPNCLVDSSCGIGDPRNVVHDVTNCNQAITSHVQSNLLVPIKEAVLTTDDLKVPCQTVQYNTDETPSHALVPYIDIWGSFSKPEVNSLLSLREPINVISKKIESQELKKDDELKGGKKEGYRIEDPPENSTKDCVPKAFKDPLEVEDFSQYGGKSKKDEAVLDSLRQRETLLAQGIKCNASANSFPCHAECHSIKIYDSRIPRVPSSTNQSEGNCHFHSGALCDSSVALTVHNKSALPHLSDVQQAGDPIQSDQTHACFSKERLAPQLYLSNDCSDLTLHPSANNVSLTDVKNREESHSNVFLGNLQLDVTTSYTESSVQILDDPSKSLSLKQETDLRPKPTTTFQELFKASNPVECMQASKEVVSGPTQSAQSDILIEGRSPFMLRMKKKLTLESVSSLAKAVVPVKTKFTRVKPQRDVFNMEIAVHKKTLKARSTQSADYIKMLSSTGNSKKSNLRPAPQSLNYSIPREAKRPKISNGRDMCPATSGLLNCSDKFSQNSESYHLYQSGQACKRTDPPSSSTSHPRLGTDISVKKQPDWKCKSFSAQENLPINIETKTCKSSSVLDVQDSPDVSVKYKLLPSEYIDLNLTSKPHCSKLTRGGAVSQKATSLLKSTQDQMLLSKLSRIANRLTAPSKCETFSSNLKVVPFHRVKMQAKKLLNVFSCVRMRMNSQPGQIWQENVCLTSSRDRRVCQSMNLYPKSYFSSLGDTFSLHACDNLTFPVSFHVNLDPSCLSDFLKLNPPDFILGSPQSTAHSSELSEWTLSLFLSSHMPPDTDNVHLLTQWNPQFRSLTSSSESSRTSKTVRKSGCSTLGLHTVLALSSPGSYRLWTRRMNLGSRIPTVQKLSVTQFAHGLKGSPQQLTTKKDQFSSLAFSMGRILSTWSQHGVSAFPSDCANTHPNCSVWLPSQNSNIISACRSPHQLACVPRLPLNTNSHLNKYSLPVQNHSITFKPRTSHQEDLGLPFCLSIHPKDPRPRCWLSSQYKNDPRLSSFSIKQDSGPKHSFIFSSVKKDNLNLPLKPSGQQKDNLERPLVLKLDVKPVAGIPLQKHKKSTIHLDNCDGSVRRDAVVDLPCPESQSKGQTCPFKQKEEIIIPCAQSQNKNQGNENGSFERKPQRVSQIRIRRTIPKPDPNLTPMGLPKPKRVNKKEFSLEDIYTNKNYKSPPPARSLETIFEEPKEKNGVLISVSQQKRKRVLEFRDCTVPRLKRPKGKVMKVMTSCKRGRKAAMEGVQLDALLIQKLMDLENCLLEEEAMERESAACEMPS